MSRIDYTRISKLLSHMLRHQPADYGLTLDAEGFADLNMVWMQVKRRYPTLDPKDWLLWLESDGAKVRYEVRYGKIRARYGHSTPEVTYAPAVPPEMLYHGTTQQALVAIRQEGLTPQRRQYVHLSVDIERAQTVAHRHDGGIILLTIRALEAHHTGIVFYHPEPRHYLAKAIPPEFIEFE